MGAWNELQARDQLMDFFIQEDPIFVALHRPTWTATDAGGRTQSNTEVLAPQTFTLYPFKRRLTQEFRFNPQTYGEEKVENIHWILIWNREETDIQVDDYFDPSQDIYTEIDDPASTPYERLAAGRYEVTFISARLWDRGQAGILYRG